MTTFQKHDRVKFVGNPEEYRCPARTHHDERQCLLPKVGETYIVMHPGQHVVKITARQYGPCSPTLFVEHLELVDRDLMITFERRYGYFRSHARQLLRRKHWRLFRDAVTEFMQSLPLEQKLEAVKRMKKSYPKLSASFKI